MTDQAPIPMLLWCPMCQARHIDEGVFETRSHHSHACQSCGMVWRPALVPTVGVMFLPGFKNTTYEIKTEPERELAKSILKTLPKCLRAGCEERARFLPLGMSNGFCREHWLEYSQAEQKLKSEPQLANQAEWMAALDICEHIAGVNDG